MSPSRPGGVANDAHPSLWSILRDRRVRAAMVASFVVSMLHCRLARPPFDVDGYRYWGQNFLSRYWTAGPVPVPKASR